MNPIDFLLDWKYEIVKILCTQKLETLNNEEMVNKFGHLDFERNRTELMKALQNLKVAEETQKIILDNFVDQNGFESLDLKPFEEIEEEYGTQTNNRDENKTIFLPMSNDFIKLCKVIWRIIKNTETEHKNPFMEYKNDLGVLKSHINCVFRSETNTKFFKALQSSYYTWKKKLIIKKFKTDKFESEEDELKAFIYQQENNICAYFGNLSRIKCMDTEYTEFANRLNLPRLDRKVVISTNFECIYATDVNAYRTYNHRSEKEIVLYKSQPDIPERRETSGQKIKKFALDLLNSLVKKWDSLSVKTKKILSGSLVFIFFVLLMLAGLNILEIAVFMSLALSWTIAIISFIGMAGFTCIFTILITDDSEDTRRNLSGRNNPDLDLLDLIVASENEDICSCLSETESESNEIPLIVIESGETENENNLSPDLKK